MAAKPPTQHAFGETPVEVDLTGEKGTITLEKLLKIAKEIMREVKNSCLDPGVAEDMPRIDELYNKLWGRFKDFAKEFPIMFRWMTHKQEYEEKAFTVYLQKFHKGMWKNKLEMLDAQAEYLVMVRRMHHRDETSVQLERYRKYIKEHLHEENKKFEEAAKEAEKICKENEEARKMEKRKFLRDLLLQANGTKVEGGASPPAE